MAAHRLNLWNRSMPWSGLRLDAALERRLGTVRQKKRGKDGTGDTITKNVISIPVRSVVSS